MRGGRTHDSGPPADGGGPLIIGHRGASARAPENTLAAFNLAVAEGADGLEFDVRLARDGVPVVIHDPSLLRTTLYDGQVEWYDSALLSQFHAGEWFNLNYPLRARPSFFFECIPTLARVFEGFGTHTLYVELKCEEPSRRAELARAVVGLTRAYGLAGRVVVKSFALDSLGEVKRLAPEIRTAALFGRSWPRPLVPKAKILAAAADCGADEISLHHSLVRAATVEAARRRGFEVLVWTVDSPVWLRRARALGLRAVFANDPGRMRRVLDTLRARVAAPRKNG